MNRQLQAKKTHPTSREDLLAKARLVALNAYAPYSKFRVGAALLSAGGVIYIGCNVENEAYPAGMCAERNAIANAVASEGKELRIEHLVIVAINAEGDATPCTPCGICRQVIGEIAPDSLVTFQVAERKQVQIRATELLPYFFRGLIS